MRDTGADLRNLDDTASNDDSETQAFRQSILEAFTVCDVEIVHERAVAFFTYEGFEGGSRKVWDVVGDCCDQGVG